MLYGIGGNKLDKDSELRDVRPDELAALVRHKNLASVVFTLGAEDRRLSDQPIEELLRIDVTPGHYCWYAFGGDTNATLVHYVTAGEGDADDGTIVLTAHRDVDADCHTGSRSLPDMTLAMTRYVACVKNGELLGFARVVYVHWLFSSSSAVAKRRAEVAAAAQAR